MVDREGREKKKMIVIIKLEVCLVRMPGHQRGGTKTF
jgi:hypothetical protein